MKVDLKNKITHPFEPVISKSSKILILGSFPSVLSRENAFYYGNPKNRFWNVLSRIFSCDFVNASIDEKKKLLMEHRVAIYDIVVECTIHGSDDATIDDVVYADILELVKNTQISHIYCNGKKAYSLYLKKFKNLPIPIDVLPSTSPANAAWNLERLCEAWCIIKEELD